jgi:hypothetical protein
MLPGGSASASCGSFVFRVRSQKREKREDSSICGLPIPEAIAATH